MKKYISLMLMILICLACSPCAAAETLSDTIAKGGTQTYPFGEAYKRNIAIEIDYDLSDKTWSGICNLPFIVMSGNTELGRISVFSADNALLDTRMELSAITETGAVGRKGTIIIHADYENSMFMFKHKTNGIATAAVLGYGKFKTDAADGITAVKIGAGGNPGTSINIRVSDSDFCTRESNYSFNGAYGFKLNTLKEFSRGTDGVITTADPTDETNGVLKIPSGEKLDMVFMPINFGFSGNVSLKYRAYAAANGDCTVDFGKIIEYITGSTKTAVQAKSANSYNLSIIDENGTACDADSKNYFNRWVEMEYVFDTAKNTITAYADGTQISVTAAATLINRMSIENTDCDVYIDDLKISEIKLYSDVLKINEETAEISGLAENAMATALLNKLHTANGSAKVISSNGTENSGALQGGDKLVLYDTDGTLVKQYTLGGYSDNTAKHTPVYHAENLKAEKGTAKTFEIGGTYTDDTAIEIDYNLKNTSWDGDCNIPFILLDQTGAEIARISIYSPDADILSARMENGTVINTGGIDRSGTLRLETDFKEKRAIFKYTGTGYKKTAALGYIPFKNADISGVGGIKIGASANPGVTVDMRVYKESASVGNTEYNFENAYSGNLSKYYDFTAADDGVVIANDPENADNKCLYIPCGKNMNLNFMPRDCGFTDNVRVKYRVYMPSLAANAEVSAVQEYITGSTKSITALKVLNDTELELSGENDKITAACESVTNRWIEIEYFLNLGENKAKVKVDGKSSAEFDIPQAALINRIRAKSTLTDMYFDDIEISNGGEIIISSDIYGVDNENRTVNGADITDTAADITANISSNGNTLDLINRNTLKVTDKSGGYSVYYTLAYRNRITDFETGTEYNVKGGTVVKAPYGKGGYALRSQNAENLTVYLPTDGNYNTVEFAACFENNTARRTITVDNANNKQFSKVYLQNQESVSVLEGDNALNHIITTEDKTWHRYKAVIDKTENKVRWFVNGRPMQTEPLEFANLYNGESDTTLASLTLENTDGAYSYIDDVTVSCSDNISLNVQSTAYTADNTYRMITDIPRYTKVGDALSEISPKGYIAAKSGRKKSDDEYITSGDVIRFESNGQKVEYALGLCGGEKVTAQSEDTQTLYVAQNANGTGTKDSPLGSLEEAFEKAAQTDGDVNITILGETFVGGRCIRNINKQNGYITLNSEAAIVGGNILSFRELDETEKELFSSAQDKILCADISKCNIGKTVQSGWNLPFLPSSAQLTVNGKTQTVARYPNDGYITSGNILSSTSQKLTFEYTDEKPSTWKNAENARIWSHFNITYGGHDAPAASIDTTEKTVTLAGTMYSANVSKPIDYYWYNVLDELDAPGEYYIDTANNKLYYYPDGDISRAVLTDTTDALLRLENCGNIIIDGIMFDGGRGNALEITECDNITVKNCKIFGNGMNGVTVTGGAYCTVENSEIAYIDGDAVKLGGGDIYTLTGANHSVKNCDIHDFSLRKKSYTSAVTTSGCGHVIKNNKIYNAPHTGLFIRSCNTEIAENSFKNLTFDAQDMGCIYSVDTYARRGISIHDNYFENIRNKYSDKSGLVKCVYMDNFTSGWEVYGNVFKNCDQGIHANGGRENTVHDNLFISVDYPLGMYNLKNSTHISPLLYQTKFVPVSSNLWKSNYKGIDEITEINPGYPNNTSVYGNVIADAKTNSLAYDAYMTLSDSATLSADKVRDGKIYDYDFCDKYVKINADKINTDMIVVEGLAPFCGEMHMTSGENKEVSVKTDGAYAEPESVVSSNETVVRTNGKTITAVNAGIADITVNCGGFTDSFRVKVMK